jgi:hypothetical protein
MRSPWTAAVAITDTQALLGRLRVVREQRVTTPDGRVWYVRRRWAKRQRLWKRQPDHELSLAERDTVPILPDIDDVIGPLGGLLSVDPEVGVLVAIALLALGSAGGRRRGGGRRALGGSLRGRQCGLDRPGARRIWGTGAG